MRPKPAARKRHGAPEVPGPPTVGRDLSGARLGRRRGWTAALVAGCLLALVSGATGFPPSAAFGAPFDEVGDPTSGGDSTTTTTSSTTTSTLIDSSETDTPLDPVLDEAKDTVNGALDTVDEDGALPRLPEEEEENDGGDETPDEPKEEEEEEGDDGTTEDDSVDDEGDDEGDEEEEDAPVPPRTQASLTALRTFDIGSAIPIVEVGTPLSRLPLDGFVDVPLGPRTTKDVVDLLESVGASDQKIAEVLAPFPVAGPAKFSNDWGAARHVPTFHPHEGTDIFASRGTPIVSPADGVVENLSEGTPIGGNSLRVARPGGGFFYFSHLDGFAPGIGNGSLVRTGDVIGYVGNTGNAAGTPPHLHFEVHPDGGEAVPPLPYLDQWLADARAEAQALAGLEPQPAPQVGEGFSPFASSPPQAGILEPAASHRDSPAATVALLIVLVVGVVAYRRRRTVLRWAAPVIEAVAPRQVRSRRPPSGSPAGFPWDVSEDTDSEPAARDVLAPLLEERDGERERVGVGR